MNTRRLEVALWLLTSGLLLTAALGVRQEGPPLGDALALLDPIPFADGHAQTRSPNAESINSIIEHDPFRLERHPSPVAYKPELEGVTPPPPPPKPPKPPLVLAGILGGPPWEALIEGIPEHTGAVLVREGDVVGGLRVRAVRRDSVIIQGPDTTWRLGLKRSWQ